MNVVVIIFSRDEVRRRSMKSEKSVYEGGQQ